jgi:Tfp pilus assembly protein PilN
MKVRLNLATAPLENNRRFIAGASLLGALGLAAFLVLSVHTIYTWRVNRAVRAEISNYQNNIHLLEQQQSALRAYFQMPQTRGVTERAAFLNALIEQRSFPWTKVFMDLEHLLPTGVRVVTIAPKMEKGVVEITLVVGAASDEAKLKFLKALEESKEFSGVELKQEQRPNKSNMQDQVLLQLVARYHTT